MTRTLVAALVLSSLLSVPAFAAGSAKAIAHEGLSSAEKAPANYNATLKAQNEKALPKRTVNTNAKITLIQPAVANPIIVLDPGHGGTDPGGTGNGLQEKDLVLDIASRTKSYMNANYPASVYMTRSTDTYLTLDQRTTYANNLGANFFVSIHTNAFTDSSPNGLETYYYPGSTNGQNLATDIYNKLAGSYSTLRGVKSADYYVLHYTNMPAALGETGFVTNATDAANLNNSTFRQTLATQYAQGMHLYWWGY
ncbi:MAG: N-acetylmuramoyl-L-alanine amidase family protein [Tumebacillaceae bacterium]